MHEKDYSEIVYKGICINHEDGTYRTICESTDKEEVDMEVYLDRGDEPSPDKDLVRTWQTLRTYKFNTKLD